MKTVLQKFKFKATGVVLYAPAALEKEFVKLGFKTSFDKNKRSTNTVVFISNQQEYRNFLTNQLKNIEPDSVLWFAYPKGSSKINSDINRDTIRMTGEEFKITTVAAIAINETWSALRFRPIDRVGK